MNVVAERSAASRAHSASPATIIAACNAAAVGFDVCARKTRDEAIAVAAKRESESLHLVVEKIIKTARSRGVEARPRKRTCDRLRWEWLASTAMVVDGRSDGRLLVECMRILEELSSPFTFNTNVNTVEDEDEGDDDITNDVSARLRIAMMTAASLSMAIRDRQTQLAFAIT